MKDYPSIIKNLNISSRLNSIADRISERGYIIKGTVNHQEDTVTLTKNDGTIEILENPKHNAYEYLPNRQKKQMQDLENEILPVLNTNIKINNFLITSGAMIMTTAVLVNVPLFAGVYAYFTGIAAFDNIRLGKIKKDLEFDSWFVNNDHEIDKKLQEGNPLYESLSDSSKEILIRDGKLTLNNIEEFSKKDLKLVKRTISREIRQQRKARQKMFKK